MELNVDGKEKNARVCQMSAVIVTWIQNAGRILMQMTAVF